MVTDAAIGGARTETAIPYGARLLVTILLLGLYVAGHFVTLPFVDPGNAFSSFWWANMSPLVLGLTPLLTGFILVELFSLVTSPGRRLRARGVAGRARLNRAALTASLLLAAFQAVGIAIQLEKMSGTFAGMPLVTAPGLTFRLLTIATLTAATAAVFVIGQLLSTYGIGNGFALLTLTGVGWAVAVKWTVWGTRNGGDFSAAQTGILLTAVLLVAMFLYVRRADTAWLPAFPQSALPVRLSLYLVAFLPFLLKRVQLPFIGEAATSVVAALVMIALFSWLGFHLFSSRRRLAANLEETEEFLDDHAASLRRWTLCATGVLALVAIAELAWNQVRPGSLLLSVADVVITAAIALDLWDQFRFQRQKGPTALLVQLDNVHFSYRLEERLQEEGVDALARGHVFRSLYFFLGPLFKIDVLVPREQLPRARQVLAELEAAAMIQVF
jgi:SecY translocase